MADTTTDQEIYEAILNVIQDAGGKMQYRAILPKVANMTKTYTERVGDYLAKNSAQKGANPLRKPLLWRRDRYNYLIFSLAPKTKRELQKVQS